MKNRLKILWWVLAEQYRSSHILFLWKFIYALFDGLSSIVYVYVAAKILDSVTKVALSDGSASNVYQWIAILFVTVLATKFGYTVNTLFSIRLSDRVELAMNEKIMRKMYEFSQEQYEDEAFNTKIGRANSGLSAVNSTLNEISWLSSSVVRFIGSFIAIAGVSPLVGLLVVALSVPGIILGIYQNRYREKVYRESEPLERIAYRSRWLLIDARSMPEVRLVNGFSSLLGQWRKHKKLVDKAYYTMQKRNGLRETVADMTEPLVESLATLIYFQSLVAGSIDLGRFVFLRGLTEQLVNSVNSISMFMRSVDERLIELENLREIFDLKTSLPNGHTLLERPLRIEFQDVSFRYPTSDTDTLKDISFVIVPGSKLALVGENGAGKSTLLKLLLRQYLPTSGRILVNGTDIKDIEQQSYYKMLGNLSQDFLTVSHFSIRDNLTLGVSKKTDQDIYHALNLVGADGFISKLKHGLDTRLDTSFKDGTDLSGGQLQRIGVARALLRDGDIMILDEPTSAIDAKAEFSIFNNIYKEHEGRTTLIVSHRFSTVRKADAIIVMAEGKITEYGSHEELLVHGGLYKEMFDLQAEGYK